MTKRLLSLLLVLILAFSVTTSAFASTGEEKYENMQTLSELIKKYMLSGKLEDDPLQKALIKKFEENPEFYNELMNAMLSQYDSHSMFVPENSYDDWFPTQSSYVGVGITLEQASPHIKITDVAKGGSAEAAGVLPGDLIYKAGDMLAEGKAINDVSGVLRGEKGTKVSLVVLRNGRQIAFTLERKQIGVPNFESRVLEDGVFYMDLNRFGTSNDYIQFVFALKDMTNNNCRSLILDLRDNPGGDLDMALNMLNRLIPDKTDFFGTAYRDDSGKRVFDAFTSEGMGTRLNKIIILSNKGSASASEVLQVSLCDLGYAVSVGEATHGKARGQYHIPFEDGSAAVITSIELIAPESSDYEGIGLKPTYEIKNTTAKHPAALCAPVPQRVLYKGSWTQDGVLLNRALAALGYMNPIANVSLEREFSDKTAEALQSFCKARGLTAQGYLSPYLAGQINMVLRDYKNVTVLIDKQLERALEIAREYAKQPQQYTVDELGNVTNK